MNTKQIVALATIISMVAVPVVAGDNKAFLNSSTPVKQFATNATQTTQVTTENEDSTPVETTERGILNRMFKNEDGSYNWIKTGLVAGTTAAVLGTGCYFGSDYIKGAGSYIKGLGTAGLDKVKSLYRKTA